MGSAKLRPPLDEFLPGCACLRSSVSPQHRCLPRAPNFSSAPILRDMCGGLVALEMTASVARKAHLNSLAGPVVVATGNHPDRVRRR